MKSLKDLFRSLFEPEQKQRHDPKPVATSHLEASARPSSGPAAGERTPAAPKQHDGPRERAEAGYKKGDVIGGKYEIRGTLGKGGFGVVYLAYDRDTNEPCALKTFRDELLADAAAREAFKKEALLWVNLERYPFILTALWVAEVSGRLFVVMDHVSPDAQGRVSLADHLARASGPLNADQTLKWAGQFCLGMEHAQARGIKCHRDIKPANILVARDGTLKISDFGLAAGAELAWRAPGGVHGSLVTGGVEGPFGLSLMQIGGKARCGTPGYMAPEVYRGEGADIRSDIYSFGLVLWQMATGSPVPPFVPPYRGDLEAYLRETYEQQMSARVPRVEGSLGPVIERCLRPSPAERYGSFAELRGALEPILEPIAGMRTEDPVVGEKTAAFWSNKGGSLATLARHEEALGCYDQALAIDPRNAIIWNNKGSSLAALGRREQALGCYDEALAIDPRHASALHNKGESLDALGRPEEALLCYDQVLAIDPRRTDALNGKGNALAKLGRPGDAIACFAHALDIDPRNAMALYNSGIACHAVGMNDDALKLFDRALAIDPRYSKAWYNKGAILHTLGRRDEALKCFDQVVAIDPRDTKAWFNKGVISEALGRRDEALKCFDKALAIDPQDTNAWNNKGNVLANLGRKEEAVSCYDKALAIDSRDARVLSNKGNLLDSLGRSDEARGCFDQAMAIDPKFPIRGRLIQLIR
jgi:tetratricopeptide (TPR) repeat protein